MPIHDYQCPTCGRRKEHFLKIADLGSTVYCSQGHPMNRMVSAPYVQGDYPAYESPVVPGKMIEGRRAHEEHLKETGCRIWEPGETNSYQKRLQQENDKFEAAIEATADELITNLPPEKKDRLAAEMEAGVTAIIDRG